MVEINPLAELTDGRVIVCDAKVNFDDNAEFRQKEIFAGRDTSQVREDLRREDLRRVIKGTACADGNVRGCSTPVSESFQSSLLQRRYTLEPHSVAPI